MRLVLILLLLSGCAQLARNHCETVYGCAPAPEPCRYDDLVIICTEDRIEEYGTWTGWFGTFLSDLVGAL